MASINPKRRGVNLKAIFEESFMQTRHPVQERLQKEVETRMQESVTQMLQREAYDRPDKRRIKRPIFIALGVWPDSGRVEILAWHLGKSEDTAEWIAFLERLEALGIRGENDLELIIHDGGSGLCAALRTVFFDAAQQRRLFHKLRNIYHAIQTPENNWSPRQRRQFRCRSSLNPNFNQTRYITADRPYNLDLRLL